MSEKECTQCGEVKPFSEYNKMKCGKHGLQFKCKACDRAYYEQNKKRIIARTAKYYDDNKDKISNTAKSYRKQNKEAILLKEKTYYQENKKAIRKKNDNWNRKNKDKVRSYARGRQKDRIKTDPNFKLSRNMRKRVWDALKGNCKSAPTLELLGCTVEQARQHLENQFTDGMSWDNYGLHGWHVDHIIPCARFDLSDPEQQKECFHYTNLQPLWAEDNLKKSDKILTQ